MTFATKTSFWEVKFGHIRLCWNFAWWNSMGRRSWSLWTWKLYPLYLVNIVPSIRGCSPTCPIFSFFLELISLLVHDKSKIIACRKTRFLICIITSRNSYLLTILNIFFMTGLNDLLFFPFPEQIIFVIYKTIPFESCSVVKLWSIFRNPKGKFCIRVAHQAELIPVYVAWKIPPLSLGC